MKRFAAVTLAALMLLTVFASAASAADTLEIRGPVFNGSNIDDIVGDGITIDATQFAAFYYDIDDNVTTETLSIKNVAGNNGNVIGEGGIVYSTTIQKVDYEYDKPSLGWDNYSLLGFFADKYIPLKSNSADKLAKLVMDSDDKVTLKTGDTLDLGEGYSLQARQVDVDGDKVWLELDKDGEHVDDEIVNVGEGDSTWDVELDDIQDEDDVTVMKVHVNQVFQGAVDSVAQIEGIWLIDYANAIKIESDDEFGELNDVSIQGNTLKISNEDTFTLTRDSDQDIAEGMSFKIADTSSNELRYYPFVTKTVGNVTNATDNKTSDNKPVDNVTDNVTNNVTTPDTTDDVNASDDTDDETPATTTPETNASDDEKKEDSPGFGVVLGLVGLVGVVYLVRRNN